MTEDVGKKSSLTQYVYDTLNRRIVSGAFPTGELPTENRLVEELRVSKTTLRQAQSRLIQEGKIVKIQGKGTFVAEHVPTATARKNIYVVATHKIFSAHLELWTTIHEALVDRLDYRKYALRLLITPESSHKQAGFIQQEQINAADSALLLLGDFRALAGYIEERRRLMPVLRVGVVPDNELVASLLMSVDDEMRMALKYLFELEHRRIAFLGGYEMIDGVRSKMEVWRRFAERHGLPAPGPFIAYSGYTDVEPHWQAVEEWMRLSPAERPTAIICVNDQVAGLVCSALARMGLSVPGDVSVMGCDGTSAGRQSPRLTSVDVQPREYARRALELLDSAWGEPEFWRHVERIPPRFLPGDSCGPPPALRGA